jgi:hypothetical protein
VLSRFAVLSTPRSIFMASRARSRARLRSMSCSAAVTSSLRMPDGVEVVPHHGGMAERRDQRAGVPVPRVQRGRADLGQPVARPGLKPAVHGGLVRSATTSSSRPRSRSTRPVIHRVGAVGLPEERSSRPGRRPPPPPDEQRRPPAGRRGPHRPHHGRPANPEVTRDRGHGVGVLADPPTGLGAGSLGQHRPGTDRGRPLGPGADPACWLTTAPDPPLAPGSTTGQPPLGRSRTRTVRRPWSSARAPRPLKSTAVAVVWTASRHWPPATTGGEDLEAVQAEQPGRRRTPVVGPAGASCLADVTHPQAMRGPRCCSGRSYIAGSSTPPHAS